MPNRQPLHTNPELCSYALGVLNSSVPLEIRASSVCDGSGLFLSEVSGIDANCEIYRTPLSLAAIDPGVKTVCHGCLREEEELFPDVSNPGTKLKACGACKATYYCSKQCQKASWTQYHKQECKTIQRDPNMPSWMLLALRLGLFVERPTQFPKHLAALKHLQSDPDKDRDMRMGVSFARQFITDTPVGGEALAKGMDAISKLRLNASPLQATLQPVGNVFDIASAMINHSCDPNAFLVMRGGSLRVRSLRKINSGEEITFSYTNTADSALIRQANLERLYAFTCKCPQCAREVSDISAVVGSSNLSATRKVMAEVQDFMKETFMGAMAAGANSSLDNTAQVESRLHSILAKVLPSGTKWPEDLEPFPAFRSSLAKLYMSQGKALLALRTALRATLHRREPLKGFVQAYEMVELSQMLAVLGSTPDAATKEDKNAPTMYDFRLVGFRYTDAAWHGCANVFGEDSAQAIRQGEFMKRLMKQWKTPNDFLSSNKYEEVFGISQRKVLDWAGLPEEKGLSAKLEMPVPN